ncbi:VTT domain-containing protein [Litorilinea aerophila]|uniref:VTT domain-containing protein n=1 Tax=Litorilinea aerophila TaxID=1204385 RepID=A0A540VJT2_9CHLR|nr:VTT domain-containing protein [Litorilinea aerophila]MCC9075497.1 VTT domain-containing protein [Litorilinea aerophila]GIV76380.1 MAG: DedA family protein [Litorilinea sp.]
MSQESSNAQPLAGAAAFDINRLFSQRARRWLGTAAILAIVVVSFWLAFNPQWVERFGRWGYVGAFFISMIASATIILPAPGIAVIIAMGTALDPVLLGIVAGLGSAVGELSGYLAGASGRAFIPEEQRVYFNRLHGLTDRYGAVLLAALAAVPFPLFDLAGVCAGMLRMNILVFLAAVAVGKSIKYIILILVGTAPLHMLHQLFP